MGFKFLPHTADIKIEVIEKTMEEAFKTSALAMTQVITDQTKIKPKIKKKISITADDSKELLYKFLEELIYLFDAENFTLSRIKNLKITEKKKNIIIEAEIAGDESINYKFVNDVKAITYNDMVTKRVQEGYKIIFVLDV